MDEARQRALELANNPEWSSETVVQRAEAFYAFLTDADREKGDTNDG